LDERLAIVVDSAGMVSVHLNYQPQPTPLNARKKKVFFFFEDNQKKIPR